MNTSQRDLPDHISKIAGHADVRAGNPMPLGTHESDGGVNFAIFSRYASRVRVEFFNHPEDAAPARAIDLDSARNRTGDVLARLGKRNRFRSTLCLSRGWPLRARQRTSFQFYKAASRSLCHRDFATAIVGLRSRAGIRPVVAGERSDSLEAGQCRDDAEMRLCQRAFQLGGRPAATASVVQDGHL